MPTQIDPVVRELLWTATRATNVITDVFDSEVYQDYLFQVVDAGTPSWTIQIQTNLISASPSDTNWVAVAYKLGTTSVDITSVGLAVPIFVPMVFPRLRAKLTVFATGTPRVLVAARLRR